MPDIDQAVPDDDASIGGLDKDHVDELLRRLRNRPRSAARYVDLRELGRGGMGVVLEVRDPELRRSLALKRIHPRRVRGAGTDAGRHYLARFLQEAQITGQLAHPGIPPVHDLSVDAEGPYFTMPVIRGPGLDEVFAKARGNVGGWSLARALGVLLKVCEAMTFAHAKGIVHRDLKPENVRTGRFGEVYVMDWGLARVVGRDSLDLVRWSTSGPLSSVHVDRKDSDGEPNEVLQTLDGDVIGTPFYMPPEQARGDLERVGPRSDVYAVGGMLYLLLSGRAPYQPAEGRISARTVLSAVLQGPPPGLAEIAPGADADLVAICEKAMEREQSRRYSSMDALAADIEAWIERRPITAGPPSLGHALRLFTERHRGAVATAATGLLALLAAAGIFVWRVTEERDAKRRALVDAQRRGDAMAASALQTRESELWPAVPARIPAMERWLSEVSDLESRLAGYREESRSADQPPAVQGELGRLIADTDVLLGLRASVQSRLTLARDLVGVSLHAAREAWDRASGEIASLPVYQGLRLPPQVGLEPLQRNAQSGLWEFWHVASGVRPVEGTVRPEDGITLVLLPGARWSYGVPEQALAWQPGDRIEAVDIPVFFCGKYEVTQAQWVRLMGSNPSRFQPLVTLGASECPVCPVESIAWNEARQFAWRLGMELLPEYWWEYACQTSPDRSSFVHGPEEVSLRGFENVRDRTLGPGRSMPAADWSDGYSNLAPVGTFQANPFGLHDMLGNVAEWCTDSVLQGRARADVEAAVVDVRTFRGGSWYQSPENCYSRFRQWDSARALNYARGARVARRLDVIEGYPSDSGAR